MLRDLLDQGRLERLRAAFESAAKSVMPDNGVRHLPRLPQKDPPFDGLHTHPRVLAAVFHILRRPFVEVEGLAGRDPLPGRGQQDLHTDWPSPRTTASQPYCMVTALWLLDDFTKENGATRLVPGSHKSLTPLSVQGPEERHPGEKKIFAEAGSVLVYNGHLWHGGTRNRTNGPRRILHAQFGARDSARPGQYPVLEISARAS